MKSLRLFFTHLSYEDFLVSPIPPIKSSEKKGKKLGALLISLALGLNFKAQWRWNGKETNWTFDVKASSGGGVDSLVSEYEYTGRPFYLSSLCVNRCWLTHITGLRRRPPKIFSPYFHGYQEYVTWKMCHFFSVCWRFFRGKFQFFQLTLRGFHFDFIQQYFTVGSISNGNKLKLVVQKKTWFLWVLQGKKRQIFY